MGKQLSFLGRTFGLRSRHIVSYSSLDDMQLPWEIWKEIVSYLPVGRTKELYTVNSALFNIAMDLRYQEARLWTGTPKASVRKDLRVFRCVIFEHIHKLHKSNMLLAIHTSLVDQKYCALTWVPLQNRFRR